MLNLPFSYSGSVDAREPWCPRLRFQDPAGFNLSFHTPPGTALMATGNGKFPSAGFVFGNFSDVSAGSGPSSALKYFSEVLGEYPFERLSVLRSPGEPQDWPM